MNVTLVLHNVENDRTRTYRKTISPPWGGVPRMHELVQITPDGPDRLVLPVDSVVWPLHLVPELHFLTAVDQLPAGFLTNGPAASPDKD